jgi:TetR/AcrR family transcriptional repressor of nem operon
MSPVACDTRQKLIDAALDLLWTNSYGAVSVDDICRAAEVKKGSFYHFFPSKVELAVAAMDEAALRMKSSLDDAFSASLDPLERFDRYVAYTCQSQAEAAARLGHVCGCPHAALGSEMAGQDCGIGAKFEEARQRKLRYFESALRDLAAEGRLPAGVDVKSKAQELYAYLLGQLITARIRNDLQVLERDLKQGFRSLIGATATKEDAA